MDRLSNNSSMVEASNRSSQRDDRIGQCCFVTTTPSGTKRKRSSAPFILRLQDRRASQRVYAVAAEPRRSFPVCIRPARPIRWVWSSHESSPFLKSLKFAIPHSNNLTTKSTFGRSSPREREFALYTSISLEPLLGRCVRLLECPPSFALRERSMPTPSFNHVTALPLLHWQRALQ